MIDINLDLISELLSNEDALKFLREWLIKHFDSVDDLRILSDDLKIYYVNLNGENIKGKIHDLAKLIIRREEGHNLINYLRNNDPKLLEILVEDITNEKNIQSSPYTLTQVSARMATEPETAIKNEEIFISYHWRGRAEDVVNHLDSAFQSRRVIIIRDKRDVAYKEDIRKFMERLGRGKCVIAVICDQYLKSRSCMFELIQIHKNGDFSDRIFPIILNDARICDPVERITYVQHWEKEIKKLESSIKTGNLANLKGIYEDLDFYTEIRATISDLTSLLKNMNTLDLETHSNSNFEIIFKSIANKLSE